MPRDPLFDLFDRPGQPYLAAFDGLARRAWEFRTELLLLAGLGAGFAALYYVRREPIVAGVELYVLVMVLVAIKPARRALTGILRAASLRRRWDSAARHCGLPHPIQMAHVRRVAGGESFAIRVGRGIALEDVAQRHRRLAASLGVRELRVLPDARADRGTVVLLRSDPLADSAGRQWPGMRRRFSLWDAIPLGVDEHGREVAVTLVERNVLLGGMPGAGKSAAVSMMLAVAASDPDVRVWLIDGKQVEFAEWEPCAAGFAHDLPGAVAVLTRLQEVMNARYADLRARGLRKVDRSSNLPLHAVFIDELALFTANSKDKQTAEFVELMRDLVARGRAAGVIVVAATQKPEGSVVATSVRDLFAYRLALRCGTPEASDTILGRGTASQGFSAASIPPGQPGVGFLLAEDGVPVRFRTFYLDDGDVRALASRAREGRARVPVAG